MVVSREREGPIPQEILELIDPAKAIVQAACQILGPERNGLQTVTLEGPNGTCLRLSRYVDVNDDIHVAGYIDPCESGLSISISNNGQEKTLSLPRRATSVKPETIVHLAGTSVETLNSLLEKIKLIRAA